VSADSTPSLPTRKDAVRNRQLLLDAAKEVFAQQGLDAGLDDIARHAGVGVGTAYRHFADKQQLVVALMERAVEQFLEDVAAAQHEDDPWCGLVQYLELSTRLQLEDRGLRHVLTGGYDPQRFREQLDEILHLVDTIVQRARTAGVVRKDLESTDLMLIATMLCAVADMTVEAEPTLWRRYLTMLLEGVKPGGDALSISALSVPEFRRLKPVPSGKSEPHR
jgi:AcrR family transcriptional regulator